MVYGKVRDRENLRLECLLDILRSERWCWRRYGVGSNMELKYYILLNIILM